MEKTQQILNYTATRDAVLYAACTSNDRQKRDKLV